MSLKSPGIWIQLGSLCLCLYLTRSGLGDQPDAPLPGSIELTLVDDEAIGYATFQSHNQKVVSNRHGIYLTYIRSASQDYLAQTWRMLHSADGGKTFQTYFEETRATNPPVLETDRIGGLYVSRPDFVAGNIHLSRFPAGSRQPDSTTLPGGAAGKFCQLLDEPRQRLYYLAHDGTFHIAGLDGQPMKTTRLLIAGPHAVSQYPHLTLGEDGTLYAAWTTSHLQAYLYRSVQAIKSLDGGQTWVTLDNLPLQPPLVSDDTGPTTRISRDDELEVHSWLSAFLAKQGKLHLVYWAKTHPERQRYLRFDGRTGHKEVDLEPLFSHHAQAQPNDSGVLVSDPLNPASPLYFVSTIDDRKRLACLVSSDNGSTWQMFAVSDRLFPKRVYSIGAARALASDGSIVGTFTDVKEPGDDYTTDKSGAVYFFRIAAQQQTAAVPRYRIETIAGNGNPGDTPAGAQPAREVPVDLPFGVEYGPDGALYITAVGSHRVLRLDRDTGLLTSVAGTGKPGYAGDGGPAAAAQLNEPYEVRFDSQGNMLILDMRSHVLRRVDAQSGVISTLAGDGTLGDQGDGGAARDARLHYPHSMAVDGEDNIYIGDILNHRVRRIDAATGRIETFVGTGEPGDPQDGGLAHEQPLTTPQGLAVYRGGLWLSSYRLHRIWRVDLATRRIRHKVGTGQQGYSGDGQDPRRATLDGPRGMKISPAGILYLAEGENNIVRAYDIEQDELYTVAGVGPQQHQYAGDGPLATAAPLWQPHGVCISADGSLILSDTINHRVRQLVPLPSSNPDR